MIVDAGADRLRAVARERRATNKAGGRCLNDGKKQPHGPVVPGRAKCARCIETHAGRGPFAGTKKNP